MLSLRWEVKKNSNVICEIQKCDFSIEIFTSTQLPTFTWQINSDELHNKHRPSLLCFQSSLSECLRNYILHVSQIFAKSTLKIRTMLRAFETKIIKKLRTSSLSKSYVVLIKKECINGLCNSSLILTSVDMHKARGARFLIQTNERNNIWKTYENIWKWKK